jgi:hypothetical protein
MWRTVGTILLGAAIGSAGLPSTRADEPKARTNEIKGGVEGKVKAVDVQNKTLTIVTAQGRERTFTITKDTTMLGPRGGKVKGRLKDKRFHEGMSVTVVAEGNTASEVHLGFQHRGEGASAAESGTTATKKPRPAATEPEPTPSKPAPTATGKAKPAATAEEADEDNEIPGKVKKYDTRRHILVVSLLNGKDRSFLLSNNVEVMVKGVASARGLRDPALKAGAQVEIVTDAGGRKVKEVKIVPAPAATGRKKAG